MLAPPISSFSSPLPILSSYVAPPEYVFIESDTFVLGNPCLDQTLDDSDIDRLEDYFEVKDLTLGPPLSFDFYISLD